MKFAFSAPSLPSSLSPQIRAVIKLAAIAGKIAVEERTAVYNTDGRPENVAEHSNMLAIVAPALADQFFPDLDANLVARYCPIHDLVEAYVGDTPTHEISKVNFALKYKREKAGLAQLKREYVDLPAFITLIEAYEAQKTPESRFVRMVDKLMPLLAHTNDNGATLQRLEYAPQMIRKNSIDRTAMFMKNYADMEKVIKIRTELAEYVAQQLEANE